MLVESTKPDVIIGTESWLSEDIKSTYFFNPTLGFKVYRRDRPNDTHGGVLLTVKSDIEVLDIQLHSTLELLSGNIKVGQKKMVLTAFYRPPKKGRPSLPTGSDPGLHYPETKFQECHLHCSWRF